MHTIYNTMYSTTRFRKYYTLPIAKHNLPSLPSLNPHISTTSLTFRLLHARNVLIPLPFITLELTIPPLKFHFLNPELVSCKNPNVKTSMVYFHIRVKICHCLFLLREHQLDVINRLFRYEKSVLLLVQIRLGNSFGHNESDTIAVGSFDHGLN